VLASGWPSTVIFFKLFAQGGTTPVMRAYPMQLPHVFVGMNNDAKDSMPSTVASRSACGFTLKIVGFRVK